MFLAVGDACPILREWSFAEPPFVPAALDTRHLKDEFSRKFGMRKYKDNGISADAWTGPLDATFGLSIEVGFTNPLLCNRVSLKSPLSFDPELDLVRRLLLCLVAAWEPDWGAYEPIVDPKEERFVLGKLTYLSHPMERRLNADNCFGVSSETLESGNLWRLSADDMKRIYMISGQDESELPSA
jgi:hypothetical protein